MKKTTLFSAAILGGMVLSNLGAVPTFAAEINSMDTNTHIQFSGHTTNPNPDELDLIWVPTTFEFGQHEVTDNQTASTSYDMENLLPKYTIVQDLRQTAHSDWKVEAIASKMTAQTPSGIKELSGASIEITGNALKSYDTDDNTIVPESEGVIVDAPSSWSNVTVEKDISLPTDGTTTAPVMTTATTDAVENGKYAAEFNTVKLTVPQGEAQEGEFSGSVTWTLSDTL